MTPTKPGWWWADGIADPVWIAIDPDKGPTYGGMALGATGLRLVAEVPGPAVSVAVAEFIETGMGQSLALGDAIRAALSPIESPART